MAERPGRASPELDGLAVAWLRSNGRGREAADLGLHGAHRSCGCGGSRAARSYTHSVAAMSTAHPSRRARHRLEPIRRLSMRSDPPARAPLPRTSLSGQHLTPSQTVSSVRNTPHRPARYCGRSCDGEVRRSNGSRCAAAGSCRRGATDRHSRSPPCMPHGPALDPLHPIRNDHALNLAVRRACGTPPRTE
jgi:hypothetical protein